jgi:mono/diheme cytochrome c family protein
MYRQERWSMLLLLCLVLLPAAVLLPAPQKQDKTTSSTRNTVEGAKIFQYHCAVCHGVDGRGHGPDSVVLKHPVPDLTLISQRSGGKFPFQRVREIIDGKEPGLLAQGDREMPIWGPIFHEVESDQDWGEVRLDAITKHMESIQQK